MFKRALFAATVVAASTAMAMTIDLEPGPPSAPASDAACRSGASTEPGCALRAIDPNATGDAALAPTDLASLAPAPPAIEWPPLHPPRSTGLDFKDAATEPGSMLHATLPRDTSHPLIPALLALGALVLLLRKRPF